jgi:signal transduction histidine kinase
VAAGCTETDADRAKVLWQLVEDAQRGALCTSHDDGLTVERSNVTPELVTESGMGMGLSIARTIVEAHNGQLVAENATNGGATFHIILPLRA